MRLRRIPVFWPLLLLFAAPASPSPDSFTAKVTPLDDTAYAASVSSLLQDAKVSIRMIMYVAKNYPEYPDSLSNNLMKELIASAKRGVKVEVILDQSDPMSSSDKTDNLKTASYLSANGVSVYLDTPEKTTHAKLIIVDEKYVVLGSTNWTYYSLARNNETNVLISSSELARHYTKYFEKVRKECRTKLTRPLIALSRGLAPQMPVPFLLILIFEEFVFKTV